MLAFDTSGPLVVFGGPYSNLAATRAMIAEAQRLGVPPERVVCTGDVVAYCAEPEETAAAIARLGLPCRSRATASSSSQPEPPTARCNFEEGSACDLLAKGWYPFANARLSAGLRAWMRGAAGDARLPARRPALPRRPWRRRRRSTAGSSPPTARSSPRNCRAAGADVVIAGHCRPPLHRAVRRQRLVQSRRHRHAGQRRHPRCLVRADLLRPPAASCSRPIASPTITPAPPPPCAASATPTAMPGASSPASGRASTSCPPAERAATGKRLRPRAIRLAPTPPEVEVRAG